MADLEPGNFTNLLYVHLLCSLGVKTAAVDSTFTLGN